MSGKKKSQPQEWESTGGRRGYIFVSLHHSLLYSAAYKDLSPRARMLYAYMKAKGWKGENKSPNIFPDIPYVREKDRSLLFTFTGSDASATGLYTANYAKPFKQDKDDLVSHGFIDDAAPNITRGNGKAKVFKFSARWEKWPTESP